VVVRAPHKGICDASMLLTYLPQREMQNARGIAAGACNPPVPEDQVECLNGPAICTKRPFCTWNSSTSSEPKCLFGPKLITGPPKMSR